MQTAEQKHTQSTFMITGAILQDHMNMHCLLRVGQRENIKILMYIHTVQIPTGKISFPNTNSLTSYLCGFDPRPHNNYYVYATNVIDDSEDINYSAGSDYYLKCHDKAVTNWIYFLGNFTDSFTYAENLLTNLYVNSNATQLVKKVYENGKAIYVYDVCTRVDSKLGIPAGYYYADIVPTNKDIIKGYDTFNNNCVQVSMKVLLQGNFDSCCKVYKDIIKANSSGFRPNEIFEKLTKVRGGGSRMF